MERFLTRLNPEQRGSVDGDATPGDATPSENASTSDTSGGQKKKKSASDEKKKNQRKKRETVLKKSTVLSVYFGLLLRWGILGLVALAIVTFALNTLGPRVSSWWHWVFPKSEVEQAGLPEEELSSQRQEHRERIQEEYQQKATKYKDEVLTPREAVKREQEEKEFYQFAGPAWKGKAHRLGDPDDDSSGDSQVRRRQRAQGSSKDASSVRKLPESVTRLPPQPEKQEKPKRIITLPDEPDEGIPKSITVALRGVTGKINKRRFLYTNQVQVLIDWMTKLGYHPQLYTLCTTYPKQDLYPRAQQTLEEINIVKDILLIVDEREEKLPDEELLE